MCSVWFNRRIFNKKQRDKCKKKHCDNGITDLPQVIFYLWKSLLDFFMYKPFTQQNITHKKCNACNIEISCTYILKNSEIIIPCHIHFIFQALSPTLFPHNPVKIYLIVVLFSVHPASSFLHRIQR